MEMSCFFLLLYKSVPNAGQIKASILFIIIHYFVLPQGAVSQADFAAHPQWRQQQQSERPTNCLLVLVLPTCPSRASYWLARQPMRKSLRSSSCHLALPGSGCWLGWTVPSGSLYWQLETHTHTVRNRSTLGEQEEGESRRKKWRGAWQEENGEKEKQQEEGK